MRNNIDLIVDKLINDTLPANKIEAMSQVIKALQKEEVEMGTNTLPEDQNDQALTEEAPPDFSEVQGVQIGDAKPKKVKIYKASTKE